MPGQDCSAEGCSARATHIFKLFVWPAGADKQQIQPMEYEIFVPMCLKHGVHIRITDLVNDEAWDEIRASLTPLPSRETMELVLIEYRIH